MAVELLCDSRRGAGRRRRLANLGCFFAPIGGFSVWAGGFLTSLRLAWWTGLSGLTINRRSRPAPGPAQVAQLVEHATENRSVGGSIPPLGTININNLGVTRIVLKFTVSALCPR